MLHLSVSLCRHLSDFDFHLDSYIPASLCLSLPSEACASVSHLSRLFWSLSFPERLSLPSRRIDLPGLRRWLRGVQSLGAREWATGWGLGSRRRRGGDTPSSAPRETRVPASHLPARLPAPGRCARRGHHRAHLCLSQALRLIRLRDGAVPIQGAEATSPPVAPAQATPSHVY